MTSKLSIVLIAASLTAAAGAAHAQQRTSDAYKFAKAVRERDGQTVTDMINVPGSSIINSRDDAGNTALHIVTRGRDAKWLAFLMSRSARSDVQDKQGETPLTLAAQMGWVEGAEELIGRGAAVDAPNGRGETPLIIAVQRRDLAMVRSLIAAGANPDKSDRVTGNSARDFARQDPRGALVLKMLEEARAKPRKQVAGPGL